MAPKARAGLGKGLEALIPSVPQAPGLKRVSVEAIVPNPRQPRSLFDSQELEELAASIREVGLIQPLIVQQLPDDGTGQVRYQLITGERRWRAARLAGLQQVDVIVKEATPQQMLELALVENIQRADLNPLEEAQAYEQLVEEFGLTQEAVAARIGRSRVSVTNTMRLLRLPEEAKQALLSGDISEGHARALLMLEGDEEKLLALRMVIKRQLSVRQTEELVRRLQATTQAPSRRRTRSPETEALENRFRDALGTRVDLFRSRKGGKLVIHFYSEEDLQTLYERIVGE